MECLTIVLKDLFYIALIVLIIFSTMSITVLSNHISEYIDKKISKLDLELSSIKKNSDILVNRESLLMIEYSNNLLKDIRELIASISKENFKAFIDKYEVSKITKENVKKLIDITCNDVKNAIDYTKIDYDHMIYSQKFLSDYIVNTTIYVLKEMVEETIDIL